MARQRNSGGPDYRTSHVRARVKLQLFVSVLVLAARANLRPPLPEDIMESQWNAASQPVPAGSPAVVVDPSQESRVLRNTYWLLALTMIPTVIGALIGVTFPFRPLFQNYPVLAPIGMFLVMLGMLFGVAATRNSGWGVAFIFAFTFVAGFFLGPILQVALGLRNGGQLIALSGGMTAAILFAMAGIATVTKKDFSFLGNF